MQEDRIFDILFQCKGRQYKDWVNPSEKTDKMDGQALFTWCWTEYFLGIYRSTIANGQSVKNPDWLTEAIVVK